MNNNKLLAASIVEIVLGAALLVSNVFGKVDDFWSGMGTALIVVGALQLFRRIKYRTNAAYRERVDTAARDERNRYLGMKAWAWSGYLYVMIAAVASIALRIAGQDLLSIAASGSICLILVLYWLSYVVLSRKY